MLGDIFYILFLLLVWITNHSHISDVRIVTVWKSSKGICYLIEVD